jgi:hypothetical protein
LLADFEVCGGAEIVRAFTRFDSLRRRRAEWTIAPVNLIFSIVGHAGLRFGKRKQENERFGGGVRI